MILQLIIGILVLGLLVIVHEAGHFIVAKWRKVTVNSFSVGFGPVLLKKKIGETEYRISAIPFGGYVAMVGENSEEINGKDGEFAGKKIWERIAIAFAGPLFNVIFAIFILWVGFAFIGIEETIQREEKGVTVGFVFDSTFSEVSGIEMGDKIIAIEGDSVFDFESLNEKIIFIKSNKIASTVLKKDGTIKDVFVTVIDTVTDGIPARYLPILPQTDVIIKDLSVGGMASKVGIKKGDRVISINGEKISSVMHTISVVDSSKGVDTLNIVVQRDSVLVTIAPFVADIVEGSPRIGVMLSHQNAVIKDYNIFSAIAPAFKKSADIVRLTFVTFENLFTGNVQLKHMSGPVGIVKATGTVASYGIGYLIFFIALISINLGLFNLLPLMITDGGLIMFFLIEAVRGKPLKIETQAKIQQVAMVFFISFAIFITFFDIKRLF